MTKLLIISPGFHGYYSAIARAFERQGYEVSTFCYDVAASRAEKVWNKARHELVGQLRGGREQLMSAETVSRRALDAVRQNSPDMVLVVRGDILTEDFWGEAAREGRPVAVWMYDEVRRTVFDADLVAPYAAIATYSGEDTQELNRRGIPATHVPLGFDDTLEPSLTSLGLGNVTFIGAPFEKRERAIECLSSSGLPVYVWGRGWSSHPVDRARTWRAGKYDVPNGRDLPAELTLSVMRNSAATLNIHGDQDGFTMRTFEACGVGAVQFIDRRDVSAFYEPDEELIVFESLEELVERARHVLARPSDYVAMREKARKRTLAEHTLTARASQLETLWS